MNKRIFLLIAVFAALALLASACEFSVSTANIANAYMAADPDGNTPTTTYAPDAIFYAIVDLANAPDDTQLRAEWVAVNAEGTEPNFFITEASIQSGDDRITFDLTNEAGFLWPNGSYRVDLYLNDELDRSLEFSVQ